MKCCFRWNDGGGGRNISINYLFMYLPNTGHWGEFPYKKGAYSTLFPFNHNDIFLLKLLTKSNFS